MEEEKKNNESKPEVKKPSKVPLVFTTIFGVIALILGGVFIYFFLNEKSVPSKEEYYLVNFDSQGGSFIETQKVFKGECATKPKDPTKDGYSFKEWYAIDKPFAFETTPIIEDITLTAIWEGEGVVYHTVSFDSQGGSFVAPITVRHSGQIPEEKRNPTSTKEGYNAPTWKDKEGNEFDFKSDIKNDITLIADWGEINKIKVVFNANGGYFDNLSHDIPSLTVKTDYGKMPNIPVVHRDPDDHYTYVFGGWDPAIVPATSDNDSYKALWTPYPKMMNITFDANGGTIDPSSKSLITVEYGSKGSSVAKPTISRPGYDAADVKWFTDPVGGVEFKFDDDTEIKQDYQLYAHWGNVKTYNVEFYDGNSEIIELKQTVNYNEKIQRPSNPEKDHYVFKDWFTEDGGNVKFDFSTKLIDDNTNPIKVYAKFEPEVYTVTFNPNGGKISDVSIEVTYNDTIIEPPTVTDGPSNTPSWWTTPDFKSGTEFIFGNEDTGTHVTKNLNLFAKYTVDPAASFTGDTWEVFFNEISGKTLEEIKKNSAYSDDYADHGNTFVGLKRKVLYNNQEYDARVIGEKTVADAGHLVFEFTQPITSSVFDSHETLQKFYKDSSVDNYLSGEVLQGLPTILQNKIIIDNDIKCYRPGPSETVESIGRKLFLLSATQLGFNKFPCYGEEEDLVSENEAFEFYKDKDNSSRIKKDINGNPVSYWTRTTDFILGDVYASVWVINSDGGLGEPAQSLDDPDVIYYYSVEVQYERYVAPAFLI